MMAEQSLTEQETFQALLWNLFGQMNQDDPLYKLRVKAWERFLELGLPGHKDDVFRYIRLRNFFAKQYETAPIGTVKPEEIAPHVLPECAQSVLVFANGRYSPSLSRTQALPKRLMIQPLHEAVRTYSNFLNSQWTKVLKEEVDPFAVLNLALHEQGAFLYLPPKTIVDAPIQILNFVQTTESAPLIFPRLQLFVGSQSELSLVSTHALSGSDYAMNAVMDIAIEDDAHVSYVQSDCGKSDQVWHFDGLRAQVKRNASLKTIAVTDGAATVRYDYRIVLVGENCEVSLNGVWMLYGKREAHVHVLVDHQAPYCRSMQLFKSALEDVSRSGFEGKILVRQAAQKTEAFQLNNNLLLSENAHADSKPNLEIFADDVKASHGATVGQLDKEQIFYMKARGLSESAAKNLLTYGFYKEVIDLITIPSLHEQLNQQARRKS